jgi:hypothetical protein
MNQLPASAASIKTELYKKIMIFGNAVNASSEVDKQGKLDEFVARLERKGGRSGRR